MPPLTEVMRASTNKEDGTPRKRIATKVGKPTGAPESKARNQMLKKEIMIKKPIRRIGPK